MAIKLIRAAMAAVSLVACLVAGGPAAATMIGQPPSQEVIDQAGFPLLNKAIPAIEAQKGVVYWGGVKNIKSNPIYVFIDPNCIFCEKIYHLLKKNEKRMSQLGEQVVIIPVAFLKPSSAGRAAAIIKDGWKSYVANEEGFEQATEDGGIEPLPTLIQYKPSFEQLATNWDALSKLAVGLGMNGVGTPFLVWKDRTGHVSYISGYSEQAVSKMIESATHDPKVKWDGTL